MITMVMVMVIKPSDSSLPGPGGLCPDSFCSKEAEFAALFILCECKLHEEDAEFPLSIEGEDISVEGRTGLCCFLDHPEDPEAPPTRATAGSLPECSLRRDGRLTGLGTESLKLELLEEEDDDGGVGF
jgi:hypothetical protein